MKQERKKTRSLSNIVLWDLTLANAAIFCSSAVCLLMGDCLKLLLWLIGIFLKYQTGQVNYDFEEHKIETMAVGQVRRGWNIFLLLKKPKN